MIQRLLGHSSLQTTDIYIQVSSDFIEEQYRKAMKNARKKQRRSYCTPQKKHNNYKIKQQ